MLTLDMGERPCGWLLRYGCGKKKGYKREDMELRSPVLAKLNRDLKAPIWIAKAEQCIQKNFQETPLFSLID